MTVLMGDSHLSGSGTRTLTEGDEEKKIEAKKINF
jgi:hypothetical protein